MPEITLKSIIWQEGDLYVAQCIPIDVCSIGSTKEEAIRKLDSELRMALKDRSIDSLPYITSLEIIALNLIYATNDSS